MKNKKRNKNKNSMLHNKLYINHIKIYIYHT